MKRKFQVLVGLTVVVLVALWLVGCDHYVCSSGATFGNSSCTASGSGLGTNTGGVGNSLAFAVDQQGTVDGFTLNTSASTFGLISNFSAPTIPQLDFGVGMVVAQKKFLYAGFGVSTPKQLFGWSINTSTGALTPVSGSPYATPALGSVAATGFPQQSMITNPAGTLLFIAEASTDSIAIYQINGDGSLTAQAAFSTFPFQPVNMTTDGLGKYLYVTDVISSHEGTGGIAAYSIGSSGALTPVAGSPFVLTTPMWQLQGEASGKYLVGTSGKTAALPGGTDDDNLYVFSINQSTGALTLNGTTPTQNSPFGIAVSPVATNGGTFVYSFSVNDTGTGFNPIEGYSLSSTGALTSVGVFSNVQLGEWGQFDQSGTTLLDYAEIQNLGTGTITTQLGAFSVASSGAITQIGSPVTLGTPGYWVVTDTH